MTTDALDALTHAVIDAYTADTLGSSDPRGSFERVRDVLAPHVGRKHTAPVALLLGTVAQLRRGECHAKRRVENPCSTCDAVDERIAYVEALAELHAAAVPFRARFGDALTPGVYIDGVFARSHDGIKVRLDEALAKLPRPLSDDEIERLTADAAKKRTREEEDYLALCAAIRARDGGASIRKLGDPYRSAVAKCPTCGKPRTP